MPDAAREGGVGTRGLVGFTVSALSPVASVFISGAGVLHLAGSGTAVGLVIGAVIALLAAVLYAELASHVPHAGGVYAGVRAALGRPAGFLVMGLALLTAPAFIAFSAQGLGVAVRAAFPALPVAASGALAIGLAAGLALLRLRTSLALAAMLLACELVAIAILAAAAVREPVRGVAEALLHPVRLAGDGWVPLDAPRLVIAVVGGAFACSGALWGTYLAEERRGAARAFGRALMWSAVIGAALVAVPLALASLAVTRADLTDPAGPLIALIRRQAGAGLTVLTGLAITVAIFNNMLTMTVALARLVVAGAREPLWPVRVAGSLRARAAATDAPALATLALAILALPLLLVPNERLLVILSAEVMTPLLASLAVLVGRRRLTARDEGVLTPAHPVLPILGLLIALGVVVAEWNDASVGRPGMVVLAVATALLMLFYAARRGAVVSPD